MHCITASIPDLIIETRNSWLLDYAVTHTGRNETSLTRDLETSIWKTLQTAIFFILFPSIPFFRHSLNTHIHLFSTFSHHEQHIRSWAARQKPGSSPQCWGGIRRSDTFLPASEQLIQSIDSKITVLLLQLYSHLILFRARARAKAGPARVRHLDQELGRQVLVQAGSRGRRGRGLPPILKLLPYDRGAQYLPAAVLVLIVVGDLGSKQLLSYHWFSVWVSNISTVIFALKIHNLLCRMIWSWQRKIVSCLTVRGCTFDSRSSREALLLRAQQGSGSTIAGPLSSAMQSLGRSSRRFLTTGRLEALALKIYLRLVRSTHGSSFSRTTRSSQPIWVTRQVQLFATAWVHSQPHGWAAQFSSVSTIIVAEAPDSSQTIAHDPFKFRDRLSAWVITTVGIPSRSVSATRSLANEKHHQTIK